MHDLHAVVLEGVSWNVPGLHNTAAVKLHDDPRGQGKQVVDPANENVPFSVHFKQAVWDGEA